MNPWAEMQMFVVGRLLVAYVKGGLRGAIRDWPKIEEDYWRAQQQEVAV